MDVFARLESEVRGYCRGWPTVFTTAQGSHMTDENGKTYLDFFAGAGTLNYGHNNPQLKRRLMDYLARDAMVHSLDMYTRGQTGVPGTVPRVRARAARAGLQDPVPRARRATTRSRPP